MKELSIEEKAKAYDEALKVLHKYDGAHIMFTQDLKEEMFPELKESEDPELNDIEKEVVEGFINRVNKKRIPITLKGELKAKFRNEFHTMWQTVGELQFAHVAKYIIERLCLHFAAWGAYNLKDYIGMSDKEKAKMDSLQEEPVSEELEKVVEEIVEPTILNAYGTKELARRLRNTICGTSVSDDLEDAAEKYAYELFPSVGVANTETELAFKAGAKWQFNQLEKNRLTACDRASKEEIEREQDFCDKIIIGEHRQPTFSDAIEYGMRLQKEQMMANAIDSRVYIDAGGYPYIPQMELYDYDKDVPLAKEGDKYKVILIKEQYGCNRKETL